jgi:two-component system OmpR family sensor kinase/two-component system phosphate regulon sensor histidine kinase PhoR
MKHLSEGRKMFISVMVVFAVYALIFILFEDYDRKFLEPFDEVSDWHLLLFSLVVMVGLAFLLHRYARRMDERISREQAAKENQMRRELTQNIAHELKTPVASILGYTDTILDNPQMPSETQQQFIERTNAQAHRLTALLQDISTLNRMDYAAHLLTMERTDVSAIVADIVEETAIALEKHHMTLNNCLPQDIIIQGNPSLIYSIFRNLIDNAINYAGESTTIDVSAEQTNDSWTFRFSDNGVGIAAEHLPRIFERFYRIDKSRSRSIGGTGLGLAIVKNAVLLHGGTITANCAENGGLEFIFTLNREIFTTFAKK